MVQIIEPAPLRQIPAGRTRQSLVLHCGGRTVPREEVFATPTPAPTRSWYPIPHGDLVREVEGHLGAGGFAVTGETHALSHGGLRYFGILELSPCGGRSSDANADHTWLVGLRNSHDKFFPAGLVTGSRVFCCDNLAFSGEIRISRKHTRFAVRDLRQLTARAVGRLGDTFVHLEARITRYKELEIGDAQAHDIVIRAVDCRAITTSQIPDVLGHWRKPGHEAFAPRTGWSLFNAFTEAHKQINPHVAVARGEALHGLFDAAAGIRFPGP